MYNWIRHWHFIAGLFILPIVLLIALTGGIYLFKDKVENYQYESVKKVEVLEHRFSYQELWDKVSSEWERPVQAVSIPSENSEAVAFQNGRFSGLSQFYINPYTGSKTGEVTVKKTDMYKVRKLHGELLLGDYGTKVIELVASWMVVLLISGLYMYWPKNGWKHLFVPRKDAGKSIFYRDIHSIVGFWFSGLLILILAGGLPWTDVFGGAYKSIQKSTKSGYTKAWKGVGVKSSSSEGDRIPLDEIVRLATTYNLPGEITIKLPHKELGVYSIVNKNPSELSAQKVIHIDAYSGKELMNIPWSTQGKMSKSRSWVMAFHQGEFGLWNWCLVLITAVALVALCVMGLLSYFQRGRPSIDFGAVSFPKSIGLIIVLVILGVFLPLFGLSLLVIGLLSLTRKKKTVSTS